MLAFDSASSPVLHRYPLRSRRFIGDFLIPDSPVPIPAHQTPSRPGRRRTTVSASPARAKCNRPSKIAKRTPMASVVDKVIERIDRAQVRPYIRDFLFSLVSAETLLLDDVVCDEQWFREHIHQNRRISFCLLDTVQPPSYARLGTQERFERFLTILTTVRNAYLRLDESDRTQLHSALKSLSFDCHHYNNAVAIIRDITIVERTMVMVLWSLIRFYVKSIFNADEFSDDDIHDLRASASLNLKGVDVGALVLISLRSQYYGQEGVSPSVFEILKESCRYNRLIFGSVAESGLANRWVQLRLLVERAQDFEELKWTAPLLDFESFLFGPEDNKEA